MPSYYHSVWRTYEDFSYGNISIQSQEGLSSNYQEQIRQPSFEEKFHALLEETKKENEDLEKWFPNIEANMEANMIANMDTNYTNKTRDMCSTIKGLAIQDEELTKAIKEQSSRQLPSDLKNDDIWECESVTLRLEEEFLSSTLIEDKDNEIAIEEKPLLKSIQVKEQHPSIKIENVFVGVDKFNFPIDSLTFGMEVL